MSFYYNVYIGETEPSRPQAGLFWIKPSTGQEFMRLGGQWIPVAGGNPIATYIEGYSWKSIAVQGSAPTAEVGKKWQDTVTGQSYTYIDDWCMFAGA